MADKNYDYTKSNIDTRTKYVDARNGTLATQTVSDAREARASRGMTYSDAEADADVALYNRVNAVTQQIISSHGANAHPDSGTKINNKPSK